MYTIIDVETTGKTNRITEISIFKYDGTNVIDEFTSLVNPMDYIQSDFHENYFQVLNPIV